MYIFKLLWSPIEASIWPLPLTEPGAHDSICCHSVKDIRIEEVTDERRCPPEEPFCKPFGASRQAFSTVDIPICVLSQSWARPDFEPSLALGSETFQQGSKHSGRRTTSTAGLGILSPSCLLLPVRLRTQRFAQHATHPLKHRARHSVLVLLPKQMSGRKHLRALNSIRKAASSGSQVDIPL